MASQGESHDPKQVARHTRPKIVGTYVPPAKRVKKEKFDVGSEEHQRSEWEDNKKKITGLINRANSSIIKVIIKELFQCNLIRYKGLFASALLKAQESSTHYTEVYAALLGVINSRIRTIGVLVVNRLILQYRLAFLNNNKPKCLATVKFIAHLTNQEIVHEALAFQIIDHLLAKPTSASVEIALLFLRECGKKLEQLNAPYMFEVFNTLRNLSLENELDERTENLINIIHYHRQKLNWGSEPPVKPSLDLIDEDDKVTHTIELGGPTKEDFHMELNYFKFDPKWTETEAKYAEFKRNLLEEGAAAGEETSSDDEDSGDESGSESEGEEEEEEEEKAKAKEEKDDKKDVKPDTKIIDATGIDLIGFRRTIYLTIRSSVRHEEVVHKLMKAKIDPALYDELCQMILDCCGQERTYESIYGLIASKFCQLKRREFAPKFEKIFELFYETIHRFETNKIRNIAKFYAHLLTTESINWSCLNCLKLRENATSSAGRCFIKFLFQELVSILSLPVLIEFIADPAKENAFKELFPKDQEQDTRFAINFFTFSGLGQLTEDLRQYLLSKQ